MPRCAGWYGLQLLEALGQLVARAAHVPALQVEEAGGNLDEALVEVALLVGRAAPQRLPRLVRMPVASTVEQRNRGVEEPLDLGGLERRRPPARQLATWCRIGLGRIGRGRSVGHVVIVAGHFWARPTRANRSSLPACSTSPPRWWQTGVVYQVYPRSFADATGGGTGDLAGITGRLDYIAWLGVDAIWISPFYPSPMADFGYDVSNYTDVDPIFGSLADFDELLAAAHDRGVRVLIDYVPNHTSDQHPWFIESRSSRTSAKRDWYVWRDAKPDGSPPNNWISMFAGPAWDWDEATGQYYLHTFLKEQPDLNWRNPETRAAMFDVARFWLDRGVDGFRIDVAPMVMKDPELRDNPPNPEPDAGWNSRLGSWLTQLHLHDHNHPDMHELYRDFRRLLESYPGDRVSIGELHHPDFDTWAKYYGERQDEIHVPFNFHVINSPWRADAIRRAVEGVQGALPDGAWASWVLGNHDQPRFASPARAGREQAKVGMLLLLDPSRHAHDLLRRGDRHGRRAGCDRRLTRPARAPRARPRS